MTASVTVGDLKPSRSSTTVRTMRSRCRDASRRDVVTTATDGVDDLADLLKCLGFKALPRDAVGYLRALAARLTTIELGRWCRRRSTVMPRVILVSRPPAPHR